MSSSVPTRTAMPADLRGVLQRVGDQVAQHLPQPGLVAEHLRGAGAVEHLHGDRRASGRSTARRARRRWPAPAGRRGAVPAAAARRGGPAAAGPRPAGPSAATRSRCAIISISMSRAAPWRYSSANPRIVVSGVRSSWLASVMNRRIRSSDVRACSADDSDDATARWICASMPLSANDSRPTSVRGSRCGTRRSSSPAGDRGRGLLDFDQRPQAAVHDGDSRRCRAPTAPRRRCPTCDHDQRAHRRLTRRTGRWRRWSARRCRPRTDIARHWTSEWSIEPTVTGTGPTSLSSGSAGSASRSLTAIQMRPSGSMPRT